MYSQQKVQTTQIIPIDQVINNLESLMQNYQTNTNQSSLNILKQYMVIYVQNHNRSQQFFHCLCQHNTLAKLFSSMSSDLPSQKSLILLQTFNIFLSNTHLSHQLVYIFSHPLFHNHLLVQYDPLSQPTQCIQYYIQLLKTIVMKLEQENNSSLLKLFCNSKYSSFPLLTNCLILSIKINVPKEELVRVTAQHCLLEIIHIINKKKLGQHYLVNLHIIIIYYEVIQELIEQEISKKSEQTTIKFLVDLVRAVNKVTSPQIRQQSMLIFFSMLSNSLIYRFHSTPTPCLHILQKLSTHFQQIQSLNSQRYISPIYEILAKYLFNKYLSNLALSSLIVLRKTIQELKQIKDINLCKFIKHYYQKNITFAHKIELNNQSDQNNQQSANYSKISSRQDNTSQSNIAIKQKSDSQKKRYPIFNNNNKEISGQQCVLLQRFTQFNIQNPQFLCIKQSLHKPLKSSQSSASWLISTLIKKITTTQSTTLQYVKKICLFACLKFQFDKDICFKDQNVCLIKVGAYLEHFISSKNYRQIYCFGQSSNDTDRTEVNFNQNRDQFKLDRQFLKVIINLTQIALYDIDMIDQDKSRKQLFQQLSHRYTANLPHSGLCYFFLHLRKYFQQILRQVILTSVTPRVTLTLPLIKILYKLFYSLQLQISINDQARISNQIIGLQKELISIIKEKGFKEFVDYLEHQDQRNMVMEVEQDMSNSVIRFNHKSSQYMSPKHKTIYGAVKDSPNKKKNKSIFNFSPFQRKNSDSPTKQHKFQNVNHMVSVKMLHLQLLRFLLRQNNEQGFANSQIARFTSTVKQSRPLFIIYQQLFTQKYAKHIMQDNVVLLHQNDIKHIQLSTLSQQNQPNSNICTFSIVINTLKHSISCQLLCQGKQIVQFKLSEIQLEGNLSTSILELPHNNRVRIKNTDNCLDFVTRESSIKFIQQVKSIKFQYEELIITSIHRYLNI